MLLQIVEAIKENKLYARIALQVGREAKKSGRIEITHEELSDIRFAHQYEHPGAPELCGKIALALFKMGVAGEHDIHNR